nr:8581_t:CDS:2 [Entrophospora candida]
MSSYNVGHKTKLPTYVCKIRKLLYGKIHPNEIFMLQLQNDRYKYRDDLGELCSICAVYGYNVYKHPYCCLTCARNNERALNGVAISGDGWNNNFTKCKIHECNKPVFVDKYGHQHPYCGRTCAKKDTIATKSPEINQKTNQHSLIPSSPPIHSIKQLPESPTTIGDNLSSSSSTPHHFSDQSPSNYSTPSTETLASEGLAGDNDIEDFVLLGDEEK